MQACILIAPFYTFIAQFHTFIPQFLLEQQSTTRASIRSQARTSSVWFESQARISSVWFHHTELISSVWFDPTEPAGATEHYYRTHEILWPDACSCCALFLKQVRCGSTLPNLIGIGQQARISSVWFET